MRSAVSPLVPVIVELRQHGMHTPMESMPIRWYACPCISVTPVSTPLDQVPSAVAAESWLYARVSCHHTFRQPLQITRKQVLKGQTGAPPPRIHVSLLTIAGCASIRRNGKDSGGGRLIIEPGGIVKRLSSLDVTTPCASHASIAALASASHLCNEIYASSRQSSM